MEEKEPRQIVTREQILVGAVCFLLLEKVSPRDHVGWEGYAKLKSRASEMMGLGQGKRPDELVEELLDLYEDDHLRFQQGAPVKAKFWLPEKS